MGGIEVIVEHDTWKPMSVNTCTLVSGMAVLKPNGI